MAIINQKSLTEDFNRGRINSDEPTTSMPSENEILIALEDVLKKMDLPPDKMRTLRDLDLKKKWDLVCDQRRMSEMQTVINPSVYLQKLAVFLDKKAMKKKKKLLDKETSTDILKHIEISLRTNSIDWVRLFLSTENDGLRILVDYLSQLLDSYTELYAGTNTSTAYGSSSNFTLSNGTSNGSNILGDDQKAFNTSLYNPISLTLKSNSSIKSAKTKSEKPTTIIGESVEDDVHVCVSCLRALMNNKFGFNRVFNSPQAIYCIVRSILHHSLRTKSLAIDLLSAICMVKEGHELILNAFNRFRIEHKEYFRFQTLFTFFCAPSDFHLDFMTACMNFINVLVHSAEDRNLRVALQYEFTALGLDRYLEVSFAIYFQK